MNRTFIKHYIYFATPQFCHIFLPSNMSRDNIIMAAVQDQAQPTTPPHQTFVLSFSATTDLLCPGAPLARKKSLPRHRGVSAHCKRSLASVFEEIAVAGLCFFCSVLCCWDRILTPLFFFHNHRDCKEGERKRGPRRDLAYTL